jgi:hypothetical protein
VALKGDIRSLGALKRALRNMPITASARIAARAAPEITTLAGGAYDSGHTVYGLPRPQGVNGDELTLERTGKSRAAMRFSATGRDIRTVPLPRYTKYLIGKYDVLPNGPLPPIWRETITDIAAQVLHAQIFGASGGGA